MPGTKPSTFFSESGLQVTTSLFCGTESEKFFFIHLPDYSDEGPWETVMGERTASYQPAPDQQSLSYPSWKYTGLPVTGLAHWSSSHRVTAWARRSKYAYSNFWGAKGSFKNLYGTGTVNASVDNYSSTLHNSVQHRETSHCKQTGCMKCILRNVYSK